MEEKYKKMYERVRGSHSKTYLRYHIVLVTKHRRRLLDGIRQQVFDAFRYCESKSDIKIHNMNLKSDHIHLIVSFPTKYSVDQTVSRLKQATTNYLYTENNTYMRRFYWKKKRMLWTHGYFCSTIGIVSENIVCKYIENQEL